MISEYLCHGKREKRQNMDCKQIASYMCYAFEVSVLLVVVTEEWSTDGSRREKRAWKSFSLSWVVVSQAGCVKYLVKNILQTRSPTDEKVVAVCSLAPFQAQHQHQSADKK